MREGRAKNGSIRGLLAGVFLLLAAVAFPSIAGAGWSAPVTVSGLGSSTSQTRIAGAADGSSWVVWKRDVGGFDVIQGSRVAIDGTQGPIQTFSGPTSEADCPVVASRADGSAMVAWLNLSAVDDTVQSRSIAADGTLGPIETRSAVGPPGQPAACVDIALGDDGTAALAWMKFNGINWVAQAVKVAADGTSGTIQDLSDPTVSVGAPAIAAAPPAVAGDPNTYRVLWPQGSGTSSNVGTRDINADGSVTDVVLVFATGAECQDPFDMDIAYGGADGAMNAFWICYRDNIDFNTGTHFFNWSVQWLRTARGVAVTPGLAPNNASPTVLGVPYKINEVAAGSAFGGQPALAWVHELDGGGTERIETWRVQRNGSGQGWVNTSVSGNDVDSAAIAVNASQMAVAGGVELGALPGDTTASWNRFSLGSFDSVTPSGGGIVYTDDPGFAIADGGKSLAAFTAIDGGSIGSARIMVFTDPGLSVDPDVLNFGGIDIGRASTRIVTIRSTGQTSNEVTGVSLDGPGASHYGMLDADTCIGELPSGSNCTFDVTFTPSSTGAQTATITVASEAGNEVVNLTGSGLNRTRIGISINKRNFSARKGKVVRIRATARNNRGVTANNTRVCVNLRKRALKLAGNRCRSLGALPAGASRTLNYRIRVTWRAQRGVKLPVAFVMSANNAVNRQVVAQIRRKGR